MRLHERARSTATTIALPETADPRVLEAADRAASTGLCRPILIGRREQLDTAASQLGHQLGMVETLAPEDDPRLETLRNELAAELLERGLEIPNLDQWIRDPLAYAALLVRDGRADGAVMGAVATTSDTLRVALRVIGPDPRFELVTSCFLMAFTDREPLIYADCGVIPQPTAAQLAKIAIQAAETYRWLVEGEPRVALLAFSTHGSARHELLAPIREAVAMLRQQDVDFTFDGELQGDAALVPAIAERKAPSSPVGGRANVLIFPDLNSGNIAYKLTERLAGARAVGPLLRGLARPIHDLSRGCSVEDILDTLAVTALETAHRRRKV